MLASPEVRDRIVSEIESRNMSLVEQKHPYFSDLPICPFARNARLKRLIKYVVCDFDLQDDFGPESFLSQEIATWRSEDGWEMLWFFSPDVGMPYGPYMHLYERFRVHCLTQNCLGFAGHKDHPFEIAGMRLQDEDYPNLQAIPMEVIEDKRERLSKTKYYDKLTEADLVLMGLRASPTADPTSP